MQPFLRILLFSSTSVLAVAAGANREAMQVLAQLPVRFEPVGADHARFVVRGTHFRAAFSANETRVATADKMVAMRFEGGRPAALEGLDLLRTKTNILRGNDRSKWQFGLPNYGRLMARGVYPGIDVVYYGAGGELEYDVVLHRGADPRNVRLRIDGMPARLDEAGNLVAGVVHRRPLTYQVAADGTRIPVASRFRRNSDGTFGFDVARYDRKSELVIDPQLTVSAYVAGVPLDDHSGQGQDIAVAIGRDAQGLIYVGGTTYAANLPYTGDAYQSSLNGTSNLFVAKIDPTAPMGQQVLYLTYAGGSKTDTMNDMVVNSAGVVFMTGSTTSRDLPLGSAFQAALHGSEDAFVMALDLSQAGPAAMYFGTYLGGSDIDRGNGIALDARGRVAVAGETKSTDFPAGNSFAGSLLGSRDAFVALFDLSQGGTGILWFSTYIGGTNDDSATSVAVAPDGKLWVTGNTLSGDYPVSYNAYQSGYSGLGDAFITQLNPDDFANSVLYSSYFGGSDLDQANKIRFDPSGRILLTGYTLSTDLPVTATAVQKQLAGAATNAYASNAFVTVLAPPASGYSTSQLQYSTYLGGTGNDEGFDIMADAAGEIYVAGMTKSTDFPVTSDALQRASLGGPAGFVAKLNPARKTLDYSSYVTSDGNQTVYGITTDGQGSIFAAGFASGPIFDPIGGVAKTSDPGIMDAFVMGFNPCSATVAPTSAQFPAAGGTATIAVTTGNGCGWTATGLAWAAVAPATGIGNGKVTVTVTANPTGATRTGTVTVAGSPVTVSQAQ